MFEIKSGPELDFAVAKAIGLNVVGNEIDDREVWVADDIDLSHMFQPSVDLRTTFEAAEKVGLFHASGNTHGQGPWVSLICGPTGWLIMKGERCIGRGETPALAICAAILNLYEEKEVI